MRIFQNQPKTNLPPIRNRVDISDAVKLGKVLQNNKKDIFTEKDASNGN